MKKYKHIFSDLDGTITESRQIISSKMRKKLWKIMAPKNIGVTNPIVVISGGEKSRIEKQMDNLPCIIMGQQGNEAPDWYNKLTKKEVKEIGRHIDSLGSYFPKDCIHNRGCQVSLSFTGHHAPISIKEKFDPKKKFRQSILKKHPFKSKSLVVRIAGTTCFDYNRKNTLKGDNLKRYMKLHKINPKDCIYYGDNFNKGGNDESVLGVMKCIKVKGPDDLYNKL